MPEDDYTVPLGVANVAREGSDITVVAYSYMLLRTLEAAEALEEEGISVEVVDPRTLIPLDEETIAASVNRTGRALVVQQAPYTGCFGEHIAHRVMERCWDDLKAAGAYSSRLTTCRRQWPRRWRKRISRRSRRSPRASAIWSALCAAP